MQSNLPEDLLTSARKRDRLSLLMMRITKMLAEEFYEIAMAEKLNKGLCCNNQLRRRIEQANNCSSGSKVRRCRFNEPVNTAIMGSVKLTT